MAIRDVTWTSAAFTHSVDDMSIFSTEFRTEEFQVKNFYITLRKLWSYRVSVWCEGVRVNYGSNYCSIIIIIPILI